MWGCSGWSVWCFAWDRDDFGSIANLVRVQQLANLGPDVRVVRKEKMAYFDGSVNVIRLRRNLREAGLKLGLSGTEQQEER